MSQRKKKKTSERSLDTLLRKVFPLDPNQSMLLRTATGGDKRHFALVYVSTGLATLLQAAG